MRYKSTYKTTFWEEGNTLAESRPKKKKNRRLLFQVGVVIVVLFLFMIITFTNMLIISSFSSSLINIHFSHEMVMEELKDWFESYKSLPWLIDYWLEKPDKLSEKPELRGYALDPKLLDIVKEKLGLEDYYDTTPEQIKLLNAQEFPRLQRIQLIRSNVSCQRSSRRFL